MEQLEQAQGLFEEGFSCSQSILMSFSPLFNLDRETAARLAAPFGGGVARRGETCGAVNGAFMVLGLKYGHTSADDLNSKENTYLKIQEFITQFQARNGSIQCSQLLEIDINTPDGLQSARDTRLFSTRCPRFVSDAVEILNQLIDADQPASMSDSQ